MAEIDDGDDWTVTQMTCAVCRTPWVATHPCGVYRLEAKPEEARDA